MITYEYLDRIAGKDKEWIQGLNGQTINIFSMDVDNYMDKVIAAGGLNLLYKIPFGLVEINAIPRQRVVADYLEQCNHG